MTASEKWQAAWPPDTHTTEYAQKRINSALSAKLTPVMISKEDMYGYFKGSSGRYETWLDTCACIDFIRGKLPCKHIYRLAMELGAMDGDFKTNKAAIPTPRKEKMSLTETIDITETLSDAAQWLLLRIAIENSSEKQKRVSSLPPEVDILLEKGLIYKIPGKSDKFAILKVSENIPLRELHYYLHRKYDEETLFDVESGDLIGRRLLDSDLPDDNATAELIKRGYYRR